MLRIHDRSPHLLASPGIVGVDEAGRGPLAGPVVAAAVLLPERFDLRGLNDSKKLSAEQRAAQFHRLKADAWIAWAAVDAGEIDRLNILQATFEAMRRAIAELGGRATEVIIDGDRTPPGLTMPAHPIVKGDAKYATIAAASIVAKHVRDELMIQYSVQYPRYGFHKHYGYPTPEHLSALQLHGPCAIHRRSFARVRELVEQPCLTLES